MSEKLSKEDFVLQAIKNLRKPPKYMGIHVRYSGFNQAFKEYFGEEARATVDAMAAESRIQKRFAKGGVMIYLPGDIPKVTESALKTILGEEAPSSDS